MKKETQEEILQFFVQVKAAKKFIPIVDETLFDIAEYATVFGLIKDYHEQYRQQPTKGSLLQYWVRKSSKIKNLAKEIVDIIEGTIRDCYHPFEGDTSLMREELIEFAQYKKAKKMFTEYSGKLKDGVSTFKLVHKEMAAIMSMSEEQLDDKNKGGFVLKDHDKERHSLIEGHPTYLHGLNSMTAAKGFYSPQLIVILAPPKSFKTGVLINIAIEYVRTGMKVYYADFENGERSIRARVKQQMMDITLEELLSKKYDTKLAELVKNYSKLGGDMRVQSFPANRATAMDVDADLERLKLEENWEPEMIVWDYVDLVEPEDKSIKEKRLKIQAVYHDIIRLNNRRDVFSFTPSQVNRNALGKPVLDMKDFGEDFGKAANCHACFALCATPEEEAMGIRRLLPVVQREGVKYNGNSKHTCVLKIVEENMQVTELSFKEANKVMEAFETGQNMIQETTPGGGGRFRRKTDKDKVKPNIEKSIKDE